MKPQVILDTNVIVAAARSRRGASAALLSKVGSGRFEINLSVALALEYEEVLKRHAPGSGLSAEDVEDLVGYLCANGTRREVIPRVRPLLEDPDDEFLAELALCFPCEYFITHNVKHFTALDSLRSPRRDSCRIPGNNRRNIMSQLTIQVPDPVLAGARKLAEREHLSVEEYLTRLLADLIELDESWVRRVEGGKRVTRERFLEILGKCPDVEPEATDRVR